MALLRAGPPSKQHLEQTFDPVGLPEPSACSSLLASSESPKVVGPVTVATALAAFLASPAPAHAAGLEALPSALAAYVHYVSLFLIIASVTAERVLIKPGMSPEEEKTVSLADAVYGVASVALLVSGYFRITQYGKGWEFYSHEPFFWVKMLLFAVAGSSSLFPTIKLLQRSLAKEDLPPVSEKLAARLIKVINGELLAYMSIPLAATVMSRGIGYVDWLPWQAGAVPFALTAVGLGYKYANEAITWKEDS